MKPLSVSSFWLRLFHLIRHWTILFGWEKI
jgi:hypothetical protein